MSLYFIELPPRAYLAVAGIFSVVMGVMTSLGLSSALGFPFTTIHGILPFLALGIGIDDMFVIMQGPIQEKTLASVLT